MVRVTGDRGGGDEVLEDEEQYRVAWQFPSSDHRLDSFNCVRTGLLLLLSISTPVRYRSFILFLVNRGNSPLSARTFLPQLRWSRGTKCGGRRGGVTGRWKVGPLFALRLVKFYVSNKILLIKRPPTFPPPLGDDRMATTPPPSPDEEGPGTIRKGEF